MPGTMIGPGHTVLNKREASLCPYEAYCLTGEMTEKQTHKYSVSSTGDWFHNAPMSTH